MLRTTRRLLQVLQLFTMDDPEWSIQDACRELRLSQSTAYVYFRDLADAGLLVRSRSGRYNVGPAVIAYDRLTRHCDPVVALAQPLMKDLTISAGIDCVALLSRLYRMTVMCVSQESTARARFAVSYERGRPMPLFRGAASKVILAHVERRKLHRYYDEFASDIVKAGLGQTWNEFKASLRRIRAASFLTTTSELEEGRVGISAPVFSAEGEVLGSLSLIVSEQKVRRTDGLLDKLGHNVGKASQILTNSLRGHGVAVAPASTKRRALKPDATGGAPPSRNKALNHK
jgi:DNA-binding IclR family transcriptional regulator